MILLFNTKITQYGLSYYHRADWLPRFDRVAIFKYCLASYSVLTPLISKSVFFVELAPEFADRQQELETYIKDLFPECNLYWYRNFYTRDWRANWDKIVGDSSDDSIWFAGNDDHIFLDYDLDVVAAGLKVLSNDPNPMSAIFYSHWAAACRMSHHYNAIPTECGNYVKFDWRTYDAIRIIKTERFRHYWFDNDFGDTPVYRTDNLFHEGHSITAPVYVPTRELVRHYDGDSHLMNGLPQPFDIANVAPPLVIPPGFFEKDIKIRIGYDNRVEGWVNLNPAAQWLYTANPTGADYRWTLDDIPLFWRDRISTVDVSPNYDAALMLQARNSAVLAMTRIPMNCYNILFYQQNTPPRDWFTQHLRK